MTDGAALSSDLEADRTRLKDVEAEILALEQALNVLRTEQSSIQERLVTYKYPVLTLPNEIVSEIFLQFLPGYPDCPPMTGLFSPTLFTHICRKWREVALATPTLWRAIQWPLHFQGTSMLESWLARSCSCPISLKFNDDPEDPSEVHVIRTLLPHRLRWEYLEINTIQGHDLDILEGPTPLLRALDLRLYDSTLLQLDESSLSPAYLIQAPLLRTAILDDYAAASFTLPWLYLTSLTLYRVYPRECTPILLQTSSLVYCQLRLYPEHLATLEPAIMLPCLKSLILYDEFLTNHDPTEYLGAFIVPALRKLEVPEIHIGADPISRITSFLAKSGCKPQNVRIPGFRSVSKALYCKAFPLISKISFDDEGNEKVDRLV